MIRLNEKYSKNIPLGLISILRYNRSFNRSYDFTNAKVYTEYNEQKVREYILEKYLVIVIYEEKIIFYNDGVEILRQDVSFGDKQSQGKFLEAYIITNIKTREKVQDERKKQREGKEFRNTEIAMRADSFDKSGYLIDPVKYFRKIYKTKLKDGTLINKIISLIRKYNQYINDYFNQYNEYVKSNIVFSSHSYFDTSIFNDMNNIFNNLYLIRDKLSDKDISYEEYVESIENIDEAEKKLNDIKERIDKNKNSNIINKYEDSDLIINEEKNNKSNSSRIFEATKDKLSLVKEKGLYALYKGNITPRKFSSITGIEYVPKNINKYNYLIVKNNIYETHPYIIFSLDNYRDCISERRSQMYNDEDFLDIMYELFGVDICMVDWLSIPAIFNYFKDNKDMIKYLLTYRYNRLTLSSLEDIDIKDYIDKKDAAKFLSSSKNNEEFKTKLSMLPQDYLKEAFTNSDVINFLSASDFLKDNNSYAKILKEVLSSFTGNLLLDTIYKLEHKYDIKVSDKTVIKSISNSDNKSSMFVIELIMKNHPKIANLIKKILSLKYKSSDDYNIKTFLRYDIKLDLSNLYRVILYTKNKEDVLLAVEQLIKYYNTLPEDIKKSIELRLRYIQKFVGKDIYNKFIQKYY